MYLLFPKIILTLLNLYGDGLIHIKGIRSPVHPLSHGDRKVIEGTSKAEAFNAYFSSVFTDDDGSDISTLQKSDFLSVKNLMLRKYRFKNSVGVILIW